MEASAGVKINSVVPLIRAPFAFEVAEIAPILLNPELEALIDAFTYSVVAIFVELSLVAGVGADGVPVKDGEAIAAFNNMSALLVVILAVFVFTFVVSVPILVVFEVIKPGKVAIVEAPTPPTLFTVVAKLPLPVPTTSPVKVVVELAAITSCPITNPKFVLAPAGVEAPVPPLATEIVPLIFAELTELSGTTIFASCRST